MKTKLAILLALTSLARSEPAPVKPDPAPTSGTIQLDHSSAFTYTTLNPAPTLAFTATTNFAFACGIVVNCQTGEVTIPPDLKLTDASRKFWLGLAQGFTGVREAWLAGYKAH